MGEADHVRSERMGATLLLMLVVFAGVLLSREGVPYATPVGGERLFTISLLTGAIVGFVGSTRLTGITPTLALWGPSRQLWLATILGGLLGAAGACYVNRTLATLTNRTTVAEIEAVVSGKGSRWHIVVKTPEGGQQRYLIAEPAALRLKDAKAVRMRYARGALGFDYIAQFEPAR